MNLSRLTGLFCICTFFLSANSKAQEIVNNAPVQDTDQRWYQVELLAFSRSGHENEELWPSDLSLSYPSNTVFLIDESADPSLAEEQLNEEPFNEEGVDRDSTNIQPLENTDSPLADSPLIESEQPPEEDTHNLQPVAFKVLPEADLALLDQARRLDRKSQYRVLFHKAWRQPAQSAEESPDIIITGGDKFGKHFELEGSVQLSVSRYLHLRTNLWLSQFTINYDQTYNKWPNLPERPEPIIIKSEHTLEEADTWSFENPLDIETADQANENSPFNLDAGLSFDNDNPSEPEGLPSTLDLYVPSRIVSIEQKPRMRSNEIHYIDHPLGGVIVRVTQVELPETLNNTAQ